MTRATGSDVVAAAGVVAAATEEDVVVVVVATIFVVEEEALHSSVVASTIAAQQTGAEVVDVLVEHGEGEEDISRRVRIKVSAGTAASPAINRSSVDPAKAAPQRMHRQLRQKRRRW